jgi:hypothetical protein
MYDDKLDLTLKNHKRPTFVHIDNVTNLQIYKSVELAIMRFENKEYLGAISMAWIMIKTNYNFTFAAYMIAYCYENGIELKKDIDLAIKFYLLSAHAGFYKSIVRLGELYKTRGFEIPHNKIFYYNMAYVFYIYSYKHYEASFYDKLRIAYLLAKIRLLMLLNRVTPDPSGVIIVDPNDMRHILLNECSDLDIVTNTYIKK